MDRQGGSITRVFRNVDLPLAILDQPELVVPLREQFRLLESAARETGDPYFGARLGQVVKGRDLSAFGAWVCSAETLEGAVRRAHAGLNVMLQTSTVLGFSRRAEKVRWSIDFVEPETDGRHHNEFLGVSYMIDMIREYAGAKWHPDVIMTVLPRGSSTSALEDIFGTNISHGHRVPAIEFDASLLDWPLYQGISSQVDADGDDEPPVPEQSDMLATIASVTELALHEGYPRIDWVASKLDTTSRTLQRRLNAHGTTFNRLVEDVLFRRAKELLQTATPITDIALRLGYSDLAHFTRAFRRWAGMAPRTYQLQHC
jgi:AraC-like DNA-binding protein